MSFAPQAAVKNIEKPEFQPNGERNPTGIIKFLFLLKVAMSDTGKLLSLVKPSDPKSTAAELFEMSMSILHTFPVLSPGFIRAYEYVRTPSVENYMATIIPTSFRIGRTSPGNNWTCEWLAKGSRPISDIIR
jgi:hypothetical protein